MLSGVAGALTSASLRLEPSAGKLARSVLRGGWHSDVLSLPDCGRLINTAVRPGRVGSSPCQVSYLV